MFVFLCVKVMLTKWRCEWSMKKCQWKCPFQACNSLMAISKGSGLGFVGWICLIVQLLSFVRLSVTPWTAAHKASLFFTIYWSLLRLTPTESVMPSNLLILCRPLFLLSSIFPSIRVFFQWVGSLHHCSFSFGISLSNEYSRLISFRMDWFDLLAVQATLKSLLQHRSLKASILWWSAKCGPTLTFIHDYWGLSC